jgi:hypothetical protein
MTKKYKQNKSVVKANLKNEVPDKVIAFLLNYSKSLEQNKTSLKFPLIHKN